MSGPSRSYVSTDGQSASLSWYQTTIWDLRPIFLSLPWKIFSNICGFLTVGRPRRREDGYVTYPYNCYWMFPAHSPLDPSPAGLVAIPYCLISDEVPILSPPKTPRATTVEVFYAASTCHITQDYKHLTLGRVQER
jgi:hypothetical protein